SGELGAVARSRRKARAGNQSGRNTQVGVTQSTVGSRGSAVAVGRTVNSQPPAPNAARRAPSLFPRETPQIRGTERGAVRAGVVHGSFDGPDDAGGGAVGGAVD